MDYHGNGYKVSADEAELYVDRLAAVAKSTASDLEELSVGMSRVASSAAAMGVGEEQLASQLATIISVTRQAPESVGTALKTILARMTDIEAGIAEDGTTLGTYTSKMAEMGINVLDANGKLREMGEVIEEIGGKWSGFSREQQIALAQTAAGTRQYNNLIALFDNWDSYIKTLEVARNAQGELQNQQDIYMESTAAHLQALETQWEGLYSAVLDPDTINDFADAIGVAVNGITQLVKGLNGGKGVLLALGTIGTQVFSKQIGAGVSGVVNNLITQRENIARVKAQIADIDKRLENDKIDPISREQLELQKQLLQNQQFITAEQAKQADELIAEQAEIKTTAKAWQDAKEAAAQYYNVKVTEQQKEKESAPKEKVDTTIFDDAEDENSRKSMESMMIAITNQGAAYEELNGKLSQYKKELEEIHRAQQANAISINDQAEAYGTVWANYNEVTDSVQAYLNQLEKESAEYKELKAAYDAFINAKAQAITEKDSEGKEYGEARLGQALVASQDAYKKFLGLINTQSGFIKKNIKEAHTALDTLSQGLDGKTQQVNSRLDTIAFKLKSAFKGIDIGSVATQISQVTGATMAVASALSSLSNLGNIWSDETLSSNEKMLQGLVAIGSAIPSLINGITILGPVIAAHPIIALGITAIGLVSAGIVKLINQNNDLRKSVQDSNKEYEDSVKELESLESSLDSVTNKIKEMEQAKKDKTSIVDDSELASLKAEEKQIKANIEIQKQLNELKAQEAARNYEEAARSNAYNIKPETINAANLSSFSSTFSPDRGGSVYDFGLSSEVDAVQVGDKESYNQLVLEAKEKIAYARDVLNKEMAKNPQSLAAQTLSNQVESMEAELSEFERTYNSKLQEMLTKGNEYLQQHLDYINNDNATEEGLKRAYEQVKLIYDLLGTYQETVFDQLKEDITDEDTFNNVTSALNSAFNKETNTIDTEALKKSLDDETFKALEESAKALGLSLQDYLFPLIEGDGVQSFTQFQSAIHAVSGEMNALDTFNVADSIQSFWQALRDGKQTEEEYLEFLDKAEAKYPELAQAGARYSHDYLQALREIADAEEAAAREDLLKDKIENLEEYSQAIDTIANPLDYSGGYKAEITADTSELEDAILDIINTDYEIAVHADIDTDVDSARSLVDEFTSIADVIGSSMEVSIEQARKIAEAGYGAIFENAKVTTDGMIRMDQQVRDNFIESKKAEMMADVQATKQQLIDNKTLVDAQIETLKAELGHINEALESSEKADQAKALSAAAAEQEKYEASLISYNNQLDAQKQYQATSDTLAEEGADNQEKIASSTYNFVQDSETDTTTQQAIEINKRIENLRKLYEALVSYGKANKESETGEVTTPFADGHTTGGGGRINTERRDRPDLTSYEKDTELTSSTDLSELADKIRKDGVLDEASRKALENARDSLKAEIANLEDLSGNLAEGISELNLTSNILDGVGRTTGKSGGSSGGFAKEPEKLELDEDPYSEVNLELDSIDSKLKRLQAESKHLYGEDYLNNQKEQLELYNQQLDAYNRKTEIATGETERLKQQLLDAGFALDENGRIIDDKTPLKSLYDQYNAMSAEQQDSEAGVALKEKIDAIEKAIEDYNEALTIIDEDAVAVAETFNDQYTTIKNMFPAEKLEDLNLFSDWLGNIEELAQVADAALSGLSATAEGLIGQNLASNLDMQDMMLDVKGFLTIVDSIINLINVSKDLKETFANNMESMETDLTNFATQWNKELKENFDFEIDTEKIKEPSIEAFKYIVNEVYPKFKEIKDGESFGVEGLVKGISEIAPALKQNIDEIFSVIGNTFSNIVSTITNLVTTFQQIFQQKVKNSIEKFNISINATLNVEDMYKQWNEFRKKVIDDLEDDDYLGKMAQGLRDLAEPLIGPNFDPNAMFDPSSLDASMGVISRLTDHIYNTIGEVNKIAADAATEKGFFGKAWDFITGGAGVSAYGNNMKQALDDLKSYTTELETKLEDFENAQEQIYNDYLAGWDYIRDSLNEQLDEYESVIDEIEHNKNVISLLYGDDSYSEMAAWYDLEEQANIGRLDYLTQTLDTWKQVREQMEAAGETSGEAWDKVVANEKEAAKALNKALESAIQAIVDKYTNAIEKIFSDITDRMTNGLGLDYLGDQWNLINQRADTYLDAINSAYEIQKVAGKYQDAINDNAGNLRAQKQITDLMNEQIEDLKTKDRLTQYDVERAEKLLNIELARIALQDAQQNKSTMRLRRDSTGNYSYQFVADDAGITDAEQNLANMQNELYNFDKEQYNSNLNELYQIYQEYNDKMVQIASDNTLSEEQRQQYLAMLTEEYQQQITNLAADHTQIRNNLQSSAFDEYRMLYEQSAIDFDNMTQQEKESFMSNMVETWVSGNAQMADAINGEGGFKPIAEEALAAIREAQESYNSSLKATKEAMGGIDFTSYSTNLGQIDSLTKGLISENENLNTTYQDMATEMIDLNKQMKEFVTNMKDAIEQARIMAQEGTLTYANNYQNAAEQANQQKTGAMKAAAAGSGAAGGAALGSAIGSLIAPGVGTAIGGLIGGGLGALGGFVASFFDTGGYTGDWTTGDGKWAVLHQKELVLNSEDTENMLEMVRMTREMQDAKPVGAATGALFGFGRGAGIGAALQDAVDSIFERKEQERQEKLRGAGIGAAASSIISSLNGTVGTGAAIGAIAGREQMLDKLVANNGFATNTNPSDNSIEQTVYVEANFPNATDSNEIGEALGNLPAIALQKIMEKRN